MAEEEGLWPVLKWVKRLIDGVLIEDFGEADIEFAWGEDAQIDAGQQAQVLTSYVGAGILTRNEARVKLGEAPVSDPAANVLTVTIASGPVTIDRALDDSSGLKKKVAKTFDPEQPRDWRERFGGSDFAKFNSHHDEKGRFATADGARAGVKTRGVRVAQALPLPLVGAAAAAGAAVGNAIRGTVEDWRKSHAAPPQSFPSSPPDDPKDKPPPVADTPREPAAAGAPAPDPDDPKPDDDKKASDGSEKPTVRLAREYKNIILDEHPGLTPEALAKIEEEAQPPGTTPDKPAGKGVTGPDVTYKDTGTGDTAATVQIKVSNSAKAAARAIRDDIESKEPSSIIAVQAPEGTSSGAVRGAIRDFPFDSRKAAGKSIVVVDSTGRILIPLGPL
jgi:hypothetical protein